MRSVGFHDPSEATRLLSTVGVQRSSLEQHAPRLRHPMAHRPTDDSAWIEIESDGQIQLALGRSQVGHVRGPVIRGELAIQLIRGNRQNMTTAWKATASACASERADRISASSGEQSSVDCTHPHGRQLGLDLAMTIDPICLMVDGADLLAQTPAISLAEGSRCCR